MAPFSGSANLPFYSLKTFPARLYLTLFTHSSSQEPVNKMAFFFFGNNNTGIEFSIYLLNLNLKRYEMLPPSAKQ